MVLERGSKGTGSKEEKTFKLFFLRSPCLPLLPLLSTLLALECQ